ncbi:hypothetical protein SNE40_023158 [Patella caerulea]|uniref:Uncharacterized protein n=1 Tax=Patella caerulea TaxID=87958 RepID=A0AAN8GBS8_PATCE
MSKQVFDKDFVSLSTIDGELATCDNVSEIDWSKSAKDPLAEEIGGERNDDIDNESEKDEELKEQSEKCCNIETALNYCNQIKTLAEKESNFELLDAVMNVRDITSKLIITKSKCAKQPKINDFFV